MKSMHLYNSYVKIGVSVSVAVKEMEISISITFFEKISKYLQHSGEINSHGKEKRHFLL